MAAIDEWFWEGNVVELLESHLMGLGWTIHHKANTAAKERGADLLASKNGTQLVIEAKGYPSAGYRDPSRSAEKKPTNPRNQAQQWYSHALLKAMRLQSSQPHLQVALAFPDFPRYRDLFEETKAGLARLRILVLFVRQSGEVVWQLETDRSLSQPS